MNIFNEKETPIKAPGSFSPLFIPATQSSRNADGYQASPQSAFTSGNSKYGTKFVLSLIVLAILSGGGYMALTNHVPISEAQADTATLAPEVDVARVHSTEIVDWQVYSGRLQAVERIDIRPQVSGKLIQVNFKDGSFVNKGDVLFTIDPRPFQAEVQRAEAQLASARARAGFTAIEMGRAERLIASNAVSKSVYDDRQNAAREAAAAVQSVQAQLATAKLDLEYSSVTAPISGRMSRAEITVGNVVSSGPNSTPLTTLVSIDQLYASFDVDEQSFLKHVNPAQLTKKPVPVHMGLANEAGFPREGLLSSVDNAMDTSSGTIRVRAVFDNSKGDLVPGLYANIRFGGTAHQAILVDDKSIGTDQNKRFVLVVGADNKANYREVKLGAVFDGKRVVESGLNNDERIIVTGLQSIRPGDVVRSNDVALDGSPLLKPNLARINVGTPQQR
ncbi:efflux RND transporter periplasmic adaptor subunit [Pseudomonas sp. LB3P14]